MGMKTIEYRIRQWIRWGYRSSDYIARKIGCDSKMVDDVKADMGISQTEKTLVDRAVELLLSGMTRRDIMAELCCSRQTVDNAAKRAGMPGRRGRPPGSRVEAVPVVLVDRQARTYRSLEPLHCSSGVMIRAKNRGAFWRE